MMAKLNIYNKKLKIMLIKSNIYTVTHEMYGFPFTNLCVENVNVHRNLCQVSEARTTSSSFLWCYPVKKPDKKGLQGRFSCPGLTALRGA